MEPDIPSAVAPWQDLVLTCGKCTRKLKGGFGRKRRLSLRALLKDGLRATADRRRLRVIEVGCLGLCPRDAVTLVVASRPGILRPVPAGTELAAVLAAIG